MTSREDLRRTIRALPFLLLVFVYFQYDSTSNSGIKRHVWKYAEGAHIGDFLWFRRANVEVNYSLNDDTLFYQGMPKGIIEKRGWRLFGDHYLLIRSVESGKTGRYCEK